MSALAELLARGHDNRLLLLAIVAAGASSFAARSAMARQAGRPQWRRRAWLAAAAAGFGVGGLATYVLTIWSVFPYLDPTGDLLANLDSPLVAVGGTLAAFGAATHARPGYRDPLFAGAILAGAVACTLFLSLSSLARPHHLAWELLPVTCTVLLAAVLCGLGLVEVRSRETWLTQVQRASCLAAAQLVLTLSSLTNILSFSDWLEETDKAASLATEPIVIVLTACGLVAVGLSLAGAAMDQRASMLARREGERMRQLADSALEGILIHRDGRVIDANAAFCLLAQAPLALVRTRGVADLFRLPADAPPLWADAIPGAPARQEIELLASDGTVLPVEVIARTISYRDGPAGVMAVRDIRERRAAEDRIRHLAHHDSLTGLANRMLFGERLGQALAASARTGEAFAVLCLDLDRFKAINDTLGHRAGDLLLMQVADRLRACAGPGDTVARTGGDEFVVLQAGGSQPQAAAGLAARLVQAMAAPFDLGGKQDGIGASIGVALCPQDGSDAEQLLNNADVALYRAKSQGRGTSCFYEPAMDAHLRQQRRLEQDLRLAFGTRQLEMYYQPQYLCGGDGALVGFEALIRWTHPEHGRVSPADFVPMAEETGLIVPLGLWTLEQACTDALAWPDHCRVAVNLSAAQFRGGQLPALVAGILARSGLPARRLELEVTESLLIRNFDQALETLRGLKALGVRIALDDFGTGYSSLSYLQRFPFDKLKIDKSFIDALEGAKGGRAIVAAILAMSRSLSLDVTAEGVETMEQLAILQSLGCGTIQGYLLGRPMPADRVGSLLAAQNVPAGPVLLRQPPAAVLAHGSGLVA